MPDTEPVVLVCCIHNSGRSVAAAGFLCHLAGDRITVFSRGSDPETDLNPQIVVVAEVGIDVSGHTPRALEQADVEWADIVVTMGCGDACPVLPGKEYVDWNLPDPAGLCLEEVRELRAVIELRVSSLPL